MHRRKVRCDLPHSAPQDARADQKIRIAFFSVVQTPQASGMPTIIEKPLGIELGMWLAEPHATAFRERRRYLAWPAGCGLCGIESLSEAMRSPMMIGNNACKAQARLTQCATRS